LEERLLRDTTERGLRELVALQFLYAYHGFRTHRHRTDLAVLRTPAVVHILNSYFPAEEADLAFYKATALERHAGPLFSFPDDTPSRCDLFRRLRVTHVGELLALRARRW
jgi:hypothetical protein